jgi:phosphoribosylaminoimidazolecarboxamide formyltransferase/IMP cyclohydrolase
LQNESNDSQKRALLSVSDKAGLPAFARGLARLGFELYSTGGTMNALETASIDVQPVTRLTGFPEILDGRVKTLHPAVHAGLLARRDVPEHLESLSELGFKAIDLICVNLYPFAETAARPDADVEEVVEQIDVGGPAMLRAAAKNHAHVIVVVRPERYSEVLTALGGDGVSVDLRRTLAAEAFAHTAAYDASIAAWMRGLVSDQTFPAELSLAGSLAQHLRYGENPHQRGAFYRVGHEPGGFGSALLLQGKELSYNNIQDAAAAYEIVNEFASPAAAIVKHTNPCGLAVAHQLADAYRKAYECDTASAFGGVVALNRDLDAATAEQIAAIFVEVVVAPGVSESAREILTRKAKLRLLEAPPTRTWEFQVRTVPGGFLAQTLDRSGFDRGACKVVSRRSPTSEEWTQLEFAWLAAKHVKSNAIVIAREEAAVGVGAGQMSRVEAVQIAVRRAGDRARGAVLASDAFFPFPDGATLGLEAGVTAIVQPGGSVRDEEVLAAVNDAGAAMVFTGQRHFRH